MFHIDITNLTDERRGDLSHQLYHLQCTPLPSHCSGKDIMSVDDCGPIIFEILQDEDFKGLKEMKNVVWCECCEAYVSQDNHFGWCPF